MRRKRLIFLALLLLILATTAAAQAPVGPGDERWVAVMEVRAPSTVNGGRYWWLLGPFNRAGCEGLIADFANRKDLRIIGGLRKLKCYPSDTITQVELNNPNPNRWWGNIMDAQSNPGGGYIAFFHIIGPFPSKRVCDYNLSIIKRFSKPTKVDCDNRFNYLFTPP